MKNISLEIIQLLNEDANSIIEKTPIKKLINRALKLGNDTFKTHKFVEYGRYEDTELHFTTKDKYVTYYLVLSSLSADSFLNGNMKKYVGMFSTEIEDKLTEYTYFLKIKNGVVEIETIKTVDSVENAKLHYEPKHVTTTILTDEEVSNIFGKSLTI